MSTEIPGVNLEVSVREEERALHLSYRVRNDTSGDLGLFNRVGGGPGDIYLDVDGDVLHARKHVLPIPEGIQIAAQPLVGVTIVPRGTTFTEDVTVARDAPVYNPMRHIELSAKSFGKVVANDPTTVDEIELSLGVFPVSPSMQVIPEPDAGTGAAHVLPPPVYAQVILSRRVPLKKAFRVLDYD